MKVGVIGAGTMGSGIAQAFAQTEDTKLYYVISMKHLLKKAKRKLLKVFRRRLPEANCQKKKQKLLSARSQQVLEINVQTAI